MSVHDTPASVPPPEPGPRRPGRLRGPLWWRRLQLLPRPIRASTYVAVLVVLALVVALLGGVVVVRRSFPQTSGTIEMAGLDGPVQVRRDDHGVAQIYASTTSDLMYAQGFVSAQDRFYSMDLVRHAAQGRLAELYGAQAVPSDIAVREMGWSQVAQQEVAQLDPETRMALDSFSDGVDAYLHDRPASRISLEYTLLDVGSLDHPPAEWTAVDSLSWLTASAWDQQANLADEAARAGSVAAVGVDRAAELFPTYPYAQHRPIVDQGALLDGAYEPGAHSPRPPRGAPDTARHTAGGATVYPPLRPGLSDLRLTEVAEALDDFPDWLGRPAQQSAEAAGDAFAVDGSMSATGKPILALDPHGGTSLPGGWLQIGLHCTTLGPACPYDVSGLALPGVPGVIEGHNDHISWATTSLGADVADLRVERIRGTQWKYAGGWRSLTSRRETIQVAGGDDVQLTVRSTAHGPLLAPLTGAAGAAGDDGTDGRAPAGTDAGADATTDAGTDEPHDAISLEWTGLSPHPSADAILELDRAHDWETFRDAAAGLAVPAQSLVFADTAGQIGYQATGVIPVRKSGDDGLLPSAGWKPEDDWSDQTVSFDALPNVLDPHDHFVVAAGQAPASSAYPTYLGADFDPGYRSQRIRTLLTGRRGLAVADLEAVQRDVREPMAATLVPRLLAVHLPRGYDSSGQRLLRGWDGDQRADSPGAAYYDVVWRDLLARTFHDDLPAARWPDGGARWSQVVAALLARPDSIWWDDAGTDDVQENRDDVLRSAMIAARDELTRRESPEARQWTWGGLHQLRLHRLTPYGALGRLFERDPGGVDGSSTTVDSTAWDAATGYDVTTAATARLVVDLGDLDDSTWVVLGGASGHAYDAHYTDQADRWRHGESVAWPSSPGAVRAASAQSLTLLPRP